MTARPRRVRATAVRTGGTALGVALLAATTGCVASLANGVAPCEHEKVEAATVDASGAGALDVEVGAGGLVVEGADGVDRVEVRGDGCASDQGLLEEIRLEARRDGDRVVVRAHLPDTHGGEQARMDVTIRVPAGMDLRADDSSGDIEVSGVGDVELTDGSGDLAVRDAGRVRIDDGSGGVSVEGVASLGLTDGSGGVEVRTVDGAVTVDDGSGGLELEDVAGDVEIEDGSGSIRVTRAGASVRIRDGSGDLEVTDSRGPVHVADGSGDIRVTRVKGDLVVEEDGSGDLQVDAVEGSVRVR